MRAKNKIVFTAIPLTIIGVTGAVAMRVMSHKNGKNISKEVKEAAKATTHEIDNAVSDFKTSIEGKSASQLERSIDSIAESTKHKIDRIAGQLKNRIHNQRSN